MRVALLPALLHYATLCISIGDARGQGFEARRGEAEVVEEQGGVDLSLFRQTNQYTSQEAEDEERDRTGGRRRHDPTTNNTGGRRRPSHDCDNSDIAECVELLEVLTNKDLGFAATVDELNKMCPVLLDGLQCIDNYTHRCLTKKHREYFNKLYAGTIRVIKDLCNPRGRYQEEYIHHAPCMRQVNPKYNKCSVTYHRKTANLNQINDAVTHLSEDEKNRNVIILCCSFQEYLQCSERVVYETCGNDTASFTKEFLDRMAGPIVQFKCTKYAPGSQVCQSAGSSSLRPAASLLPVVALFLSARHLLHYLLA